LNQFASFIRMVDRWNEWIGRTMAWLTLGTVVVCFLVVVLRYVFKIGFIWMQDLYVWLHAIVFMVGAGYTMLHGGHVRVDVIFARLDARRKAWIDLLGTLVFLFPWILVVAWMSWPFVTLSWQLYESSPNPQGMPGVFILKSVILAFCFVVGVQGLAILARSVLVLAGGAQPPLPEGSSGHG
jgi:TRAP-type mannitol/chloroaromatic compound transport system permease small subunit